MAEAEEESMCVQILKKHDKLMPHAPCRQFYITHLHQQPWVQVSFICGDCNSLPVIHSKCTFCA